MAKDDLITAVVARGRSIALEGGTEQLDKQNNRRKVLEHKVALPGERVTLPREEAEELIEHGFLLKPDGQAEVVLAPGPAVLQEGKNAPGQAVVTE